MKRGTRDLENFSNWEALKNVERKLLVPQGAFLKGYDLSVQQKWATITDNPNFRQTKILFHRKLKFLQRKK